jgi:hypothetical protein
MVTLQKSFYRHGYQYLERLRQTGPQSFDLVGHTAEPGGLYMHELTPPEAQRWISGPEQVTRIE